MAIDFQRIEQLNEIWRNTRPDAFDVSPDGMWKDETNPAIYNMGADVIDDVKYWNNNQRGIWLVTGAVGAGKTVLITSAAYKGRFYFGRTPILDYKPTALFGYYEFFNQQTLVSMLEQMNGVINGEITAELKKTHDGANPSRLLEQVTRDWLDTAGKSYFQHSVMVLDETKRYLDKRKPFNPMGLLLSDIFVIWRHLDILILLATTDKDYLDFRTFKELTCEARCVSFGEGNSWAFIHRVKYVSPKGVVEVDSKLEYYPIHVFRPREILNGQSWSKLYNTTNLISMKIPKSMKREG